VTPAPAPTPAVQSVIDRILEDEGGIKDVGDGKGLTRFGQTPEWLEDNGFVPPSNAADAAVNYATWMARTRLTEICEIDPVAGYLVTDCAVIAGMTAAITQLQVAIGVPADGKLGPVTFARLREVAGYLKLWNRLIAQRFRHTCWLLSSTKIDRRKWAQGWGDRIADQLELLPVGQPISERRKA